MAEWEPELTPETAARIGGSLPKQDTDVEPHHALEPARPWPLIDDAKFISSTTTNFLSGGHVKSFPLGSSYQVD